VCVTVRVAVCVAVCCSLMQFVASSVLQSVAVCVAVSCSAVVFLWTHESHG